MNNFINRKKYIKAIEDMINSGKIWILIWARRVWKTFLMNLFYQKYKNQAVWYSFEEDIWIKFSWVEDFLNFLKLKTWKTNFKYIFLDEIQLVPWISWILKKIYDSGYNFKILASWSGSFRIWSQIEDSLIWRAKIINVYPLTFEEFFEFRTWKSLEFFYENYTQQIFESFKFLTEEYLKFWGYPEVVLENSIENKIKFLADIYNLWLNKDIKLILTGEDFFNFPRFLRSIAIRTTSIVKLQLIANELGVTLYKVKKFFEILKQSFVIFSLTPLVEKYNLEVKSGEKVYFFDNWLLNYILEDFSLTNIWKVIENYVISEIYKLRKDYLKLYFWKKRNQSEIDLVIKNILSGEYVPVEIKTKSTDALPKIFLSFTKIYGSTKGILINKDYKKIKNIEDLQLQVIPILLVDKIVDILS